MSLPMPDYIRSLGIMNLLTSRTDQLYGSSNGVKVVFTPENNCFLLLLFSSGISTCDTIAMRPRQITPLRKVKEEDMTYAATTQSSTVTAEYNGWCNRETWVVNLWLTNEECYYHELCSIIKNFDTTDEQAEEIEQYVRFITDSEQIGIAGDLLATSLGRVSWHEIAACNQ